MKRSIIITSVSIVTSIFVLIALIWVYRAGIISFIVSRDYNIPVSIETIMYRNSTIKASNIEVDNLRESHSKNATTTKKLEIQVPLKDLFNRKELTVENINIKNMQINIEYFNRSGSENNWSDIIKVKTHVSRKPKEYLIKRIVFENLQVSTYKTNGTVKNYPVIPRLELNNISSNSGFPIDQIEKAIFNAVLKNIFNRFELTGLLDTINPIKIVPRVMNIFPFFGKIEKEVIEQGNTI